MRRKHKPLKYDADGVPIDPIDWDADDWRILWMGYKAIKAGIAARHAERREAWGEATNGGAATTP